MSFSFLFSSFERNEALGKVNERPKKRSQKWDFCVFLSIHLSLLFSFIRTKTISSVSFYYLHVLQTEIFYALCRHTRPDVTKFYQVPSINHT